MPTSGPYDLATCWEPTLSRCFAHFRFSPWRSRSQAVAVAALVSPPRRALRRRSRVRRPGSSGRDRPAALRFRGERRDCGPDRRSPPSCGRRGHSGAAPVAERRGDDPRHGRGHGRRGCAPRHQGHPGLRGRQRWRFGRRSGLGARSRPRRRGAARRSVDLARPLRRRGGARRPSLRAGRHSWLAAVRRVRRE